MLREILRFDHLAEIDGFARGVRQFDADDVAAGHDRDAGRERRHRAGDVVGEADDARGFDARRRLEFVERDDRAGAHWMISPRDAEILQHAFEQAGILLQRAPAT